MEVLVELENEGGIFIALKPFDVCKSENSGDVFGLRGQTKDFKGTAIWPVGMIQLNTVIVIYMYLLLTVTILRYVLV